jgi:hypothetical protein
MASAERHTVPYTVLTLGNSHADCEDPCAVTQPLSTTVSTVTMVPCPRAQIRAANLSGDCALGMEFMRGNLSEALVGQHKRCVRRRALLSVSLNPYCQVS